MFKSFTGVIVEGSRTGGSKEVSMLSIVYFGHIHVFDVSSCFLDLFSTQLQAGVGENLTRWRGVWHW